MSAVCGRSLVIRLCCNIPPLRPNFSRISILLASLDRIMDHPAARKDKNTGKWAVEGKHVPPQEAFSSPHQRLRADMVSAAKATPGFDPSPATGVICTLPLNLMWDARSSCRGRSLFRRCFSFHHLRVSGCCSVVNPRKQGECLFPFATLRGSNGDDVWTRFFGLSD